MSDYSLDVLVNGKPITKYSHNNSIYIEGRKKSEYSIRFRNRTSEKVLAIISVDGLSIMDGEEATYKSSGYVVDAFSDVVVKGWRISDEEIAKFIFGSQRNGYATKSGKPENTGVIGVAVFKEYHAYTYTISTAAVHEWIPNGYRYMYRDSTTGNTDFLHNGVNIVSNTVGLNSVSNTVSCDQISVNEATIGSLATEFGSVEKDEVVEVDFTPQIVPSGVIELHYGSREDLIGWGVKMNRKRQIARAFPKESKFCKPPVGWSR
jgi:hypothetical protein